MDWLDVLKIIVNDGRSSPSAGSPSIWIAVAKDRAILVKELVDFSRPVAVVLEDLADFGWESVKDLATLEPANIQAVLDRFLSGELPATEVEYWANSIECRDEIGMGQAARDALFELANPTITRPLTKHSAADLVAVLQCAAN